MHYDPEANLLSWEIAQAPIDHCLELGNFIIHLSKGRKPVLIEILNASKLVGEMDKAKGLEGLKKTVAEMS